MNKKYTIGIFADSYPDSGFGHISRCSAVAEGLRSHDGLDVIHLLPSGVDSSWEYELGDFQYVEPTAADVYQAVQEHGVDVLLVDSYHFLPLFYTQLKEQAPLLPVLSLCDDANDAPTNVHGIIDCNLHASVGDYPVEIRSNSIIGAEFYPIRSSFLDAGRVKSLQGKGAILITFGGADPDLQTERVLSLLSVCCSEQLTVIIGKQFINSSELKNRFSKFPNITFIENCSNIAPFIAKAKLVITGGGVTLAECLALSTYAVVLGLAENLEKSSKAAEHSGQAAYLGLFSDIKDEELSEALQKIVASVPDTTSVPSLVDGKGGRRIAERIYDIALQYHSDTYSEINVREEYEDSSGSQNEFEKAKWGSEESMLFRFKYAQRAIDWNRVSNWCDIGCGTGAFFRTVYDSNPHVEMTGVDLCNDMVEFTQSTNSSSARLDCFVGSFLDFDPLKKYSLVTSVGVLQKCGIPLQKAFDKMASLLDDDGVLFLTTKNLDWEAFSNPDIVPFEGHHWFTLQQLKDAVTRAGMELESIVGLLPAEGKITLPNEAHSVAIMARKK